MCDPQLPIALYNGLGIFLVMLATIHNALQVVHFSARRRKVGVRTFVTLVLLSLLLPGPEISKISEDLYIYLNVYVAAITRIDWCSC